MPGAMWVGHLEWGREFNNAPDAKKWADRVGKLGIDNETSIVVYGDGTAPDAALIWWILRYWGLRDVRLLNGGWKAWHAAGGAAATNEPQAQPKRIRLTPQEDRLATKDQILGWLKNGQKQLVDARSSKEYFGETVTAEHVARSGAKHLEWSDLVDKDSQRLKAADELARLFKERGIAAEPPDGDYCQSGRRSSVMAFA